VTDLDDAVAALVRVAEAAGVVAAKARADAEAIAAFVVGGEPGPRDLRDRPTDVLARLVADGSPAAPDYARALVDIAAAATEAPDVSLEALTRASALSSAQLRASGAVAPSLPVVPTTTVATATAPGAPAAEAALEPARPVAELLAELDDLVGLDGVKAEVHRQAALLRMANLREGAGLRSPDITRHLVFNGNPGTGKTTVARLVAGIYRSLGVLPKGQLVECDRSELVAGYVGQTAMKTAEVIDRAVGGVLFIDEAYSLTDDQYGEEAVATLVKGMEDHRDELVVIVAGYPRPMQAFIESNPGLASRFRLTLEFADLTDDQLVEIFGKMAASADFAPTDGCVARVRELLARQERGEGFGNARFIRNVFEAAVVHHAWRLREVAAPTAEQLGTLVDDDVELPPAPPPETDGTEADAAELVEQLADAISEEER
jgi:hypothetical protein